MKKIKGVLPAVAVFASAVSAHADGEYRLFVSGWPAENVKVEAASSGSDLETGAYTASSPEDALDARFCTWSESSGRKLNTTVPIGYRLILR